MGRAQGNSSAARGSSKRRQSAQVRAFIAGKSDKVVLETGPIPLGAEWALAQRRGGGAHGKSGRDAHKANRAKQKLDIKRNEL